MLWASYSWPMDIASLHQAAQEEVSTWPAALVTGATSGIGRALTCTLAANGVKVVACGRDPARLADLQALSPCIHTESLNLSDLNGLPSRLAELCRRHADVGVVFNNAGLQHNVRWLDDTYSPTELIDELAVNLTAPMIIAKVLLPHILQSPKAMLVNIGSGLALAPKATAAAYCTAKAGTHAFSRALRLQMKDRRVRIAEAVMPLVDTPMTAGRGRAKLAPTEAVRQTLEALAAGKNEIWVGKARLLPVLQRFSPSLLEVIMQKL